MAAGASAEIGTKRPDVLRRVVAVAATVAVVSVGTLIAIPMIDAEMSHPMWAKTYELRNKAARALIVIIPLAESVGVTGLLIAIGRSRGRVIGEDDWVFPIVGLAVTAGAIGLWFVMGRLLAGGMP